jgi:spore coat protein U-like protein
MNGADWPPEQATITNVTKAIPAVVTATNTFVNGDIVTISGVAGMTQLNTNRYVVANASGSSFSLYDLFGNPVDSTGYGTYVAAPGGFPGGFANCISTPPTAPVLNALTGAVVTPGGPPGNFYDIGSAGLTLGYSLFNTSADTWYWEAFYQTPTGW